jgi:hypothetical protein
MGNDLQQYRAAIGSFGATANNIPHRTIGSAGKRYPMNLWVQIFLIQYMLALCMDVQPHPGPTIQSTNNSPAHMTMCHINIRSINVDNRFDEIKNQIAGNYDLITASESWLKEDMTKRDYTIQGYSGPFRLDRTLQDGGGVMAWTRHSLVSKRRMDLHIDRLELAWVEVRIPNHKMLLGVCYRQPDTKGTYGENFWGKLQTSLELARATGIPNIIITGDLNADPQTDRRAKTSLDFFLNTNHLTQHITEPTRVTPTRSSILDLIITNYPRLVTSTTVVPPVHTNDHCTITGVLKFVVNRPKAYTRTMWDYRGANFDAFRTELNTVNWEECFESGDIDTMVENWTTKFKETTKKSISHKTVTVRPEDKTWYNGYLRRLCRTQQRDHRSATRDSNDFTWEKYRTSRNLYTQEVQRVKREHEEEQATKLVGSIKENPKKWWTTAKETLGINKNHNLPSMVSSNGTIHDSDTDKANLFNEYFTGIQSLQTEPPQLDEPEVDQDGPHLDSITATEQDVTDLLSILDVNKAYGPDDISPRVLKEAAPVIVTSITRLFNMSLASGVFPASWKMANVVPIYKKAEEFFTSNYRPISLLSILAKVFERVVFKYLFNYFRDNFMISIWQSGFLPGTSTVTQLIEIYDQFCKAVSAGKDIRVVFLDISKAFDRVWHEGLIYKLKGHGITGTLLRWLQSYLDDRKQRVIINGAKSEWGSIKAGVPQGSVLGPLLFLIFINDLTYVIRHCKIRLFADDTCLYIEVEDPQQAAIALNADLDNIQSWADRWLITFSPPKTEDLIITNKRPRPHPELSLGGEAIKQVSSHKHLGVHLTKDLSWRTHAEETSKKANKCLGIIRPLKHRLDRRSLETLYTSFVRPVLEYADAVWDTPAENRHPLKTLDKVQKEAAKIVSGATSRCTTEALHTELGWERLSTRRKFHRANMLHKIEHGFAPNYLQDLMPDRVQARTRYNLRNTQDRDIPLARISSYSNSFFPAATRQWNELAASTKRSPTSNSFKRNYLKEYPRPKQNPLFYQGTRACQTIFAKLRLGCSQLHHDLHSNLHVRDSPLCACPLSVPETAKHFFFECPRYRHIRQTLKAGITTIDPQSFNLEAILYGNPALDDVLNSRILKVAHKFVVSSHRF